jgi:ABC-type lipoprotein export system ATPase subunit
MNKTMVSPPTSLPQRAIDSLLAAQDLHKTYRLGRVDVPVLKGASLDVRQGEWVAILGASGSGKSTLLHLLGDLDQPDPNGGFIHFDGRDLNTMSRHQRNRYRNLSVGFVFQFYHLLPELNVLENAILPSMVGLSRMRYYSVRADLHDRASALLDSFGLSHRLKHRPRELSGGERQRVAIARAVYFGAKVLILDEPTSALGVSQASMVLRYIAQARARNLGVIFITHNVHHAYPVGDAFTLLNRGRTLGTFRKEEISREEVLNMMAGGKELAQLDAELAEFTRTDATAQPQAMAG